MSHAPKRWSVKGAVFTASLAVIFAACSGGTASPSASAAAPSAAAPSGSAAAFTGTTYPTSGPAPCGVAPYTGNMKQITAVDRLTVKFELCGPDAAFLPKVAFSVFGIQDSDYLAAHVPDGSILSKPNGTGPYVFKQWDKGNRIVWTANPDYWGDKAKTPTLEFHWSDESAARLLDLKSGTVDGIDNPGTTDIATIQADTTLKFYPRAGLNTLFLGFNNTQKPFDDVR